MARFNEILVGRYNRALQKILSMKGQASVVQLASEIQPAFSLFYGSENRAMEGWERFGFATTVAAGGVGNKSALRLRNPAGSNVIAVLEKVTYYTTGAAADIPGFQRGSATTFGDYATVISLVGNRLLDSRQRQTPTLVASSVGIVVSTGTTFGALAVPANTSMELINMEDQEIPMTPDEVFQVSSNNANQAFSVVIWWRERYLEESERS